MPITKLKSKAQVKAMFAAASGHSSLGIPASVGKEFTAGAGNGEHKGLLSSLPDYVAKKKKAKKAKGLI
jgi:hypothetical protein